MRCKPWCTNQPAGSIIDSLCAMPFLLPDGPLCPGTASVDHFTCLNDPGLVGHSKGTLTLQSYRGGAVFVDTESMVSYVHLQTSLNTQQTIAGKVAFEREMAKYGWAIISYHADNGIFAYNDFKAEILSHDQPITFCGVGGHHQNDIAEKHIGDLALTARAMLLHATLLWPEAVTTALWPYAMLLANDLCNLQLQDDGCCYLQWLSQSDVTPSFSDFHPFGCPVVVLCDSLHSGACKVPCWDQQSWVGIYLVVPKFHASSVPLVLNLVTGHITTPFHVVFDDDFSLVESLTCQDVPNHWARLYAGHNVNFISLDEFVDPSLPSPSSPSDLPLYNI